MNAGIKKLKEICSSQMLHGNSRTQDIIIQSLPCIAWLTLELVLYPLFFSRINSYSRRLLFSALH